MTFQLETWEVPPWTRWLAGSCSLCPLSSQLPVESRSCYSLFKTLLYYKSSWLCTCTFQNASPEHLTDKEDYPRGPTRGGPLGIFLVWNVGKKWFFWIYERCRDFLGHEKNRGIFLKFWSCDFLGIKHEPLSPPPPTPPSPPSLKFVSGAPGRLFI